MKAQSEKLKGKRRTAIAALLQEPTIAKAAKRAGISPVTIWRYMKEPEFQIEYNKARTLVVDVAILNLQQGCKDAVSSLCMIASDEEASASTRVSAAKAILDQTFKGMELMTMNDRLAELEILLASVSLQRKSGQ